MLNAFFQLLIIMFMCYNYGACLDVDTINATLVLRDSDTINSSGKQFTLGFFSPNGTTNRYMGIWYYVSPASVTWVANRERPLNDSSGTVSISSSGNIVLMNGNKEIIWSSDVASSLPMNTTAQLLNSGNLVLRYTSSGSILWESHRHPVDSFLPTMRVSHNPRTDERVALNSWTSFQDPGHGNFTSGIHALGIAQIYIWDKGIPRWRSGPWNGQILTGVTDMYSVYVNGFSVATEEDGTVYFTRSFQQKFLSRNFLDANGFLVEALWDDQQKDWNVTWTAPKDECDFYNKCGPFSLCYSKNTPTCSCLRGYEPMNKVEWDSGIWGGGCVRRSLFQCERESNATDRDKGDRFARLTFVKVPDFMHWSAGVQNECRSLCLKNCSCLAYAYDAGIGCMFWNETLIDIQKFDSDAGSDFYIRVAYSELGKEKDHKVVVIVSVIAGLFVVPFCLLLSWWMCKRRWKHVTSVYEEWGTRLSGSSDVVLHRHLDKVSTEEMPLYSFEMLANATNKFNMANKLGMGGFGLVYKGTLTNGKQVAVKRLSAASGQGVEEFMNEVVVISKLQHRNLVRLLGCCVEKGEKMLIYEYLQNKSLDVFLFDETQHVLDWRKRFSIIEGIGRGLLYLHRDSRLRIIHRDLKPSNILLDNNWIPKISDFGMARIFGGNQDQAKTGRVVGTYGYMAPEYAMRGRFSEKSGVFSFGVLVLEIISGKRNTCFYNDELSLGLLGYAWKLWNEDNALDLIDKRIWSSSFRQEFMRCIHMGLLCVQESPVNRPTISTVLSMVSSEIVDLPVPEHPGFTDRTFVMIPKPPLEIHVHSPTIGSQFAPLATWQLAMTRPAWPHFVCLHSLLSVEGSLGLRKPSERDLKPLATCNDSEVGTHPLIPKVVSCKNPSRQTTKMPFPATRNFCLKPFLESLLVILLIPYLVSCLETDTITGSLIIEDPDTIVSSGKVYRLGFFSPGNTTNRYMGIWNDVSQTSIVWVANRDKPLINDSSGTITVSEDGNLVLMSQQKEILWSSNVTNSSRNTSAQLLDSGNLVLRDNTNGRLLWESFRHPGDAFLPTMKVTDNVNTGERAVITSWRTLEDPDFGSFTAGLQALSIPQIFIWNGSRPHWRSGPWNGLIFTGVTDMYAVYLDGYTVIRQNDGTVVFTRDYYGDLLMKIILKPNGSFVQTMWDVAKRDWNVTWVAPIDACDVYNVCGRFGSCNMRNSPMCSCLKGYEPVNKEEWEKGNWNHGCERRRILQCDRSSNSSDKSREDRFSKLTNVKVPDFIQVLPGISDDCEGLCLNNCSCIAYSHDPGIGCMLWRDSLIDVRQFPSGGSDLYVRVAYSVLDDKRDLKLIIIIPVITGSVALSICIFVSWMWRTKRIGAKRQSKHEIAGRAYPSDSSEIVLIDDIYEVSLDELPLYSFQVLANATDQFDEANLLGKGGFGPVYKGKLANGK
ncbi:G-type lectin S-receptor-like serine/threonine-protein kinase [Sesamum angolense]|uniref:non-specific serine/threonine protein kinase n=1 Tax=Sesamum angolense TaxID=2727404 RepID=A0AAE1WT55_9LAMI|nr:G-type lectin S-receptor-like serine/threonine-protein kinase [Sesamum angolense]